MHSNQNLIITPSVRGSCPSTLKSAASCTLGSEHAHRSVFLRGFLVTSGAKTMRERFFARASILALLPRLGLGMCSSGKSYVS